MTDPCPKLIYDRWPCCLAAGHGGPCLPAYGKHGANQRDRAQYEADAHGHSHLPPQYDSRREYEGW